MFASFMVNAWIAATIVAVVAGVVGFFIVMRGSSFMAHAVPHGAFAGAAWAVLAGFNPLIGLGIFAGAGAVAISVMSRRRARGDVVTALALTMMLGLGAFFLSRSGVYSSQVFALLFGQILGVSSVQIVPVAVLGALCLATVAVVYRPLMLASVLPDMTAPRGVNAGRMSLVFALVVAAATTMSVPIVGALLMFALLVGPPAAAACLVRRPGRAIGLSVAFALVTVWAAIALAYLTDLPVGFFVTSVSAVLYLVGRVVSGRSRRRGSGKRRQAVRSSAPVGAAA